MRQSEAYIAPQRKIIQLLLITPSETPSQNEVLDMCKSCQTLCVGSPAGSQTQQQLVGDAVQLPEAAVVDTALIGPVGHIYSW